MNRWKTAFFICITILLLVTGFSVYAIVDQGVTLTHQKESCSSTESDLDKLMEIINHTDLTKAQIEDKLKNHRLHEYMDFRSDTISLERILLVFSNNKLKKVEKQW